MRSNYPNLNDKYTISYNATPLCSLGITVCFVFLILKLCNLNNPDFEWLSWFWVWFPFWLPLAVSGAVFIVFLVIYLILNKRDL